MRTAARVRPTTTPPALLLGALLSLTVAGCDDDNSGSGGADGSSSTTGNPTTTTGPDGSSTSAGSAAGSSSSSSGPPDSTSSDETTTGTGTSTSSGTTGDSSSSTEDTTGTQLVDVPFTVHDPGALELAARVPVGWVVVTTDAQWEALTDAPVPAGVSFPAQWVLFGSRGPQAYPGHALSVDALAWQGDTLSISGEQIDPADDCETYDFIWPADTLLSFDALDGKVEEVDDQTTLAEASCAAGSSDSMDCDLESPCATGLLCAGIIRSTVLANDPGGLCLDSINRGAFTGGAVSIPTDGATAEISMAVAGLSTVDMDVTILLELDHPAPQELVIGLRNPDGNEVSVANLQNTEFHPGGVPIVPVGFSGDESVNGTWTLVVRDTVDNDNNGSVLAWDLEIMSRLD